MDTFFSYFDECYVINTLRRKDRWRDTQKELTKVGAPRIRRFNAVCPREAAGFPSAGARGCFLSHLGVLRDAQQRELTRILILEDDVSFTADFSLRAEAVIKGLRSTNWGIFYGGGNFCGEVPVPPEQAVQTSHFMGIAAPNISSLVTYFEAILAREPGDPSGGAMHVDGAYSWYRKQHPHIVAIAAVPPLGYQRASRSDVHAKWFDLVPLVSVAAAMVRRAKSYMRDH